RHTRFSRDWSSDVCSSDLAVVDMLLAAGADVDARDLDHRSTPAEWMLAREQGAGRYDLARYLVEQGASTDVFLAAALGLTDRVQIGRASCRDRAWIGGRAG